MPIFEKNKPGRDFYFVPTTRNLSEVYHQTKFGTIIAFVQKEFAHQAVLDYAKQSLAVL